MLSSFIYPIIRKPLILKDHYIETNNSTYNQKEYRPLLWSEILFSSVISGVSGGFGTIYFIGKDIWKMENNIRKLEKKS